MRVCVCEHDFVGDNSFVCRASLCGGAYVVHMPCHKWTGARTIQTYTSLSATKCARDRVCIHRCTYALLSMDANVTGSDSMGYFACSMSPSVHEWAKGLGTQASQFYLNITLPQSVFCLALCCSNVYSPALCTESFFPLT